MSNTSIAGARESNEWTMQEFSLDQLVLPTQDKTRQASIISQTFE